MKANTLRTMGAAAVLLGGMGGASFSTSIHCQRCAGRCRELRGIFTGSHAQRFNRQRLSANVTDLGAGPEKLSVMLIRPLCYLAGKGKG